MVPCNVMADEILTDHLDRYRAMLVDQPTRCTLSLTVIA